MVDSVFLFKAVKPKQLSVASVRGNILNALLSERRHAIELLNQTITTFTNPPAMVGDISYKGGDVAMIAGPSGNDEAVKNWHRLDKGTSVRYAVMSRDWQSKTARGRLQSGRGAGRVVARGRRAVPNPMPGIQARGWTPMINKMMKRGFQRKIQRAVTDGIRSK